MSHTLVLHLGKNFTNVVVTVVAANVVTPLTKFLVCRQDGSVIILRCNSRWKLGEVEFKVLIGTTERHVVDCYAIRSREVVYNSFACTDSRVAYPGEHDRHTGEMSPNDAARTIYDMKYHASCVKPSLFFCIAASCTLYKLRMINRFQRHRKASECASQ